MRRLPLRFRLRTFLIAVAVVGLGIETHRIWKRWTCCEEQAFEHARLEQLSAQSVARYEGWMAEMVSGKPHPYWKFDMSYFRKQAKYYRWCETGYRERKEEFRHAAFRSWAPVPRPTRY